MSYILDALNKSEQERREQQQVPNLHAIHQPDSKGTSNTGKRLWLFGAILLVALAMLALWLLSFNTSDTAAKLAQREPAPAPAVQENLRQDKSERTTVSTPKPLHRETPLSPAGQSSATVSASGKPLKPTSPTLKESPNKPHNDAVVSLYSQPQETPTQVDDVIKQLPPEVASEVQNSLQRTAIVPVSALPASTQAQLPNMYYSAHIYSNEEGKGFAIINDRSRYKGDVIGPGLFVQEVIEEGVILNYKGQAFLLDALTDWPQ